MIIRGAAYSLGEWHGDFYQAGNYMGGMLRLRSE